MANFATRFVVALTLLLGLSAGSAHAQALPTPEQYLGFRVGTDKKLARWDQVLQYMQMADRASDRIAYSVLGKTTMGNDYALVSITAPKNHARLAEIQRDQRRLAYPYDLDDQAAEQIIQRNPAVCLITLTIHSSEIGSTQMSLELVHRLATEESDYVRNLLDNVVFLLVPSQNPDGQVLIIDWYNRNVGTSHENAAMPWLYHKYTGHDANRDAYMLTQVETRLVTKILYQDWFPHAFLDEHQMGSSGARIFVPPFADPINPNQDPLVLAGTSLMGMYMFNALNAKGYSGVKYGEQFSWWWQGSAKNGAWYHNMIGLLTEVASARIASPIEQRRARLGSTSRPMAEGGGGGDGEGGALPAPTDTWPRTNYPRPWLGGTWRLRDIIDYELVVTYALLEGCAANRQMVQRNFYQLNRKAIETGRKGDPFAVVLPADQRDPGAAANLLEVLDLAGIEIYRAKSPFKADDRDYPAGSTLIPMGQPFRNYVKDLLEPQAYPMRPVGAGQSPERPYDVTGWTLPLQMGVRTVEIRRPFEVAVERVSPIPPPAGEAAGPRRATVFLLPHEWNASAAAVNRLLAQRRGDRPAWEVSWASEPFTVGDAGHPAGTILVRLAGGGRIEGDRRAALEQVLRQTHVAATAVEAEVRVPAWRLRAPRIAFYQPWIANMDEGWTRWLLEKYDFPYTSVHNEDFREGKIAGRFDVVLLASQSKSAIINGSRGAATRPEHRGGLEAEGVRHLEEFVRGGGTLVTLDAAADFAIDELDLPVRNVLRGVPAADFYCPGAVLETLVDPLHPVAYGMPARTSCYFLNSPAFELVAPFAASAGRAVARYPSTNPLQSGWIGGPEHLYDRLGVVEASHGRGRVVLIGFRAQFRAQPAATFKLLFNALQWSAATKG